MNDRYPKVRLCSSQLRCELMEINRLLAEGKQFALNELEDLKSRMCRLVSRARRKLDQAGNPGCKEVANIRRLLGDLNLKLQHGRMHTLDEFERQKEGILRALRNVRHSIRAIDSPMHTDTEWELVLDELHDCSDAFRSKLEGCRLHLALGQSCEDDQQEEMRDELVRKLWSMHEALSGRSCVSEGETYAMVEHAVDELREEGGHIWDSVKNMFEWEESKVDYDHEFYHGVTKAPRAGAGFAAATV